MCADRERAVQSVPVPTATQAPTRIVIEHPAPTVDCGRYPIKRTVGDAVHVSADIFRDGHDVLRAVVLLAGPGRRRGGRSRRSRPVDAHHEGVRWEGAFAVDRPGRWEWTIEAWADPFATWRDEVARKLEAGQQDLAGEASEGAVLLARRRRGAPTAATARRSSRRADGAARRRLGARTALDAEIADARRAPRRALRGHAAGRAARGRRRPRRWPASAPGTSCSRAPSGGFRGVQRAAARGWPSWASTSSTCRRSTRSATRTARARNNTLVAGPDDPGSPWAIGDEHGGHEAIHPDLGHDRGLRRARRGRQRARHRDRAGLRDPVLGRPPVAHRAPRVVQPPPGRHAQVRREPAQEATRTSTTSTGTARTGGACGRRCTTSCAAGSTAA